MKGFIFVKLKSQTGTPRDLAINIAHIVHFGADPRGGSLIFTLDGSEIEVTNSFDSLVDLIARARCD